MPSAIPPFLRRRVRAIAARTGGNVRAAFAIATAVAQRRGELEPGTHTPTAAGRKVTRRMAAQQGHAEKIRDYESELAGARVGHRHENSAALCDLLGNPVVRSLSEGFLRKILHRVRSALSRCGKGFRKGDDGRCIPASLHRRQVWVQKHHADFKAHSAAAERAHAAHAQAAAHFAHKANGGAPHHEVEAARKTAERAHTVARRVQKKADTAYTRRGFHAIQAQKVAQKHGVAHGVRLEAVDRAVRPLLERAKALRANLPA